MIIKTDIVKTGIYMRVSTEDQAKDGFSIHAQREKLSSYANINDWEIVDYYIDEGISAKNIKDRPDINRLINDVKEGKINNVLVYKLDRLTRSVKDLISLIELFEQYNCTFSSVTEKLDTSNAVGRMFIKIIGIFAEFERENLAERVSFGYEQKTREGNYTNTNGVNGFDYIVGKGDLIVNEQEKEIVNRIFNMYLEGNSMLKIARILNQERVQTKRGGYWSQSTIKSILTNPLYIGKIRYGVNKKIQNKSFVVDGEQEQIIDEERFNRVQEMISKRKKYNIKKYPSENAYFSSVLRCNKCGGKFHPKQQKQNGKYYITYYCNNKQLNKCDSNGISHNKVLKAFEGYISNIILDKSIDIKPDTNHKKQIEKLTKELENIDKKRKRLQMLFIDEQINNSDYQEMITQLEKDRNRINENIKLISSGQEKIDYNNIKDIIINVKKNWDYLDKNERNMFINQFVKYINIDIVNGQVIIKEIKFI